MNLSRASEFSHAGTEVGMLGNDVGSRAPGGAVSKEFVQQMQGYGLTTAEILYRRPDRKWLLQSYVWQSYDLFPKFPKLQEFLAFWQEKLEGPLFAVTVAHSRLIRPRDFKAVDGVFRLN
jgi:uncharacterized protein Usg